MNSAWTHGWTSSRASCFTCCCCIWLREERRVAAAAAASATSAIASTNGAEGLLSTGGVARDVLLLRLPWRRLCDCSLPHKKTNLGVCVSHVSLSAILCIQSSAITINTQLITLLRNMFNACDLAFGCLNYLMCAGQYVFCSFSSQLWTSENSLN